MTKITLEDVAEVCDVPRYAALCRSAQAVIEEARADASRHIIKTCPLCKALAAHARNEQGTGEGK